jgi:SAM-dependent methyltransferase
VNADPQPIHIVPAHPFAFDRLVGHAGEWYAMDRGIAVKTDPQQWAYAVSLRAEPPAVKDGFVLVRVSAWVERGAVGIGILASDESKFIREVFITAADGPSVIDFAIDGGVPFGPLVIRNSAAGGVASEMTLESMSAYHLSGKGAGQFDAVRRAVAPVGVAEITGQGVLAAPPAAAASDAKAAFEVDLNDREFFGTGDSLETMMQVLAACDFQLSANPRNATALVGKAKVLLQLDRPADLAEIGGVLAGTGHPSAAPLLKHILVRLRNAVKTPDCANIGGGPFFHYANWINLDAVEGPLNPHGFALSPNMTFPVADSSIRIVYSSHCIEHLDDATVDRVFAEAKRSLRKDGYLVLKIPQFERAIAAWRAGDASFFEGWGIENVAVTWPVKGVEPNLSSRAGMIFCGYWNEAYGDRDATFSGKVSQSEAAFHGPPALSEPEWAELFNAKTPHEIALHLRATVKAKEPSSHFNHQNAWSTAELCALLQRHGFIVLSTDAETICRRLDEIPNLRQSYDQSLYCLAAVK